MWETDGFTALLNDLDEAPVRVGKEMAKTVRSTAAKVEADAKRRVPVQSGRLQRALDTRIYGDGRQSTMTAVVGTSQVPYAHLVEYGTAHSAPHPFLRPAFEQHVDGFVDGMADAADDIL